MRYRVTVRGNGIELRGAVDGSDRLQELATRIRINNDDPIMVVASPLEPPALTDYEQHREIREAATVALAAWDAFPEEGEILEVMALQEKLGHAMTALRKALR